MIKNPSHPKKSVRKVKQCKFTEAGLEYIDYKDVETLSSDSLTIKVKYCLEE